MALTNTDVTDAKLVVFDFDGTLADSMPGIIRTARHVMHEHGWTDEQLGDMRRIVGPPFPYAFQLVYGVSAEEAASITEDYRAIYKNLDRDGWPLFDGMRELLCDLRAAGKLTAIASSKRQFLLDRGVDTNEVRDLFDLPRGKQADDDETKAQIIDYVLETLGVAPADAVMVGDRQFDAEAAHTAGLECVGTLYGNTCQEDELVQAGCCAIANTVDELRAILIG
jgi:phosphoglycolate phosphatase